MTDLPPTIIVKSASGLPRRIVSWLGWLGFVACAIALFVQIRRTRDYFDTSGGLTEHHHSGPEDATDKVVILSLTGIIGDGEGFAKGQIDRIRKDQHVKAIVLRVNSPGGTVTGSDYIYHHLKKLREDRDLPIVVSMGSIAASGGYYVSMAVGDQKDAIFAEPTSTTGSIGVIIPHYDLSGLLDRFNVKDDSIVSHPRKQMLSPTRPIPEDHRAILQGYVNESAARFKTIVQEGRPTFRASPAKLDDVATGEVFTATQALDRGLIDKIGFIEDAIDRAIELAGLDKNKVRIVKFNRPHLSVVDFLGFAQAERETLDVQSLFELSAPRAYYLATSLPPLVSSRPEELTHD